MQVYGILIPLRNKKKRKEKGRKGERKGVRKEERKERKKLEGVLIHHVGTLIDVFTVAVPQKKFLASVLMSFLNSA